MRPLPTLTAAAAALALALPASAAAEQVGISPAGGVAFFESAHSLVAEDVNALPDVYGRVGNQTVLLTSGTAKAASQLLRVSEDAKVAFFTIGHPLEKDDDDLYVRTPAGVAPVLHGTPQPLEVAGLTDDGAKAFLRTAAPLLPADTDDKFDVYELDTATRALKLRTPGTVQDVKFNAVAPDGNAIFISTEDALDKFNDPDLALDIYHLDGAQATLFSRGPAAIKNVAATFHAAGRTNGHVIFSTEEKLIAGDTDTEFDVYRSDGVNVTLLSPTPNDQNKDEAAVFLAGATADAGRVVFRTTEPLLPADADAALDIYSGDGTQLTLLTPGTAAAPKFEDASDDAQTLLFSTDEKLLVTDTDAVADLYRANAASLLHVIKTNAPYPQWNGRLSGNGVIVALDSVETLVPEDTDSDRDVYTRSVATGVKLASTAPPEATALNHGVSTVGFLPSGAVLMHTRDRLSVLDTDQTYDAYTSVFGQTTFLGADTVAPDTFLDAPAEVPEGEPISATLSATDLATFACRVDGSVGWKSCESAWEVGVLPPGEHWLQARATDGAGNADPTTVLVLVTVVAKAQPQPQPETTPPTPVSEPTPVATEQPSTPQPPAVPIADTTAPALSGGKAKLRARRTPQLTFALSEDASVQVLVQRKVGRKWKTVATKTLAGRAGANRATLRKIAPRGSFRLLLSATDRAGNRSAQTKLALRR
jgi:hypothetical protein